MVLLGFFLNALTGLVVLDAVLSWVQGPEEMPRSLTRQLMEPIYAPIHALVDPSKTGGMDLSPIIVLVLLGMIQSALGLG